MIFYVNIREDDDGENVISSVTDYPIINEYCYTLLWDTNKYGWITEETVRSDLDDLISKNPSLLYNGYYEVLFESIEAMDAFILEEILGTYDDEVVENNINWNKLIQNSKDKHLFPKKELHVEVDDDGYRYFEYTQCIDAKDGKLTYIGMSQRELLQFIKDNCYKG